MCDKCGGLTVPESSYHQGDTIWVRRCVICGTYDVPEENRGKRALGRAIYRLNERIQEVQG
jgi:hypothetical protein